jgi:hypothetical protein
MTVARVTPARARQLGLPGVPKTTPRRKGKQRDRSTVPDRECARNVCHACGEIQAGEAAEARHVKATGHARYESTLTYRTAP